MPEHIEAPQRGQQCIICFVQIAALKSMPVECLESSCHLCGFKMLRETRASHQKNFLLGSVNNQTCAQWQAAALTSQLVGTFLFQTV